MEVGGACGGAAAVVLLLLWWSLVQLDDVLTFVMRPLDIPTIDPGGFWST